MTDKSLFGDITHSTKQIEQERKRRRNRFVQISVPHDRSTEYKANGWEVATKLKQKTVLKREKPIGEQLEDRVWLMLQSLGYPTLNIGKSFFIDLDPKSIKKDQKQIDVFAKDEETVVIVECKAAQTLKSRSLQKDLGEFSNHKGKIAATLRLVFGEEFKPKIIWLFATHNILWSDSDLQRAKRDNIQLLTDDSLLYFEELAKHLGAAARFQFLAYYLEKQRIPGLSNKKIPAIKSKLGGENFYAFVAKPIDLLKIAFVHHRTLNDPESLPSYQRLMNKSRLTAIRSFIENDGFFPTNIIINFNKQQRFEPFPRADSSDVQFGNLILPDTYKAAWVIDGQHRLFGFSDLGEKSHTENVFVIAFENMSGEKAANLFVEINHEQKTVSKSLIDDLKGELHWDSPEPRKRLEAVCSRLVNELNADMSSPLFGRVVQTGLSVSRNKRGACLSLPSMIDGLQKSQLLGYIHPKTKNFADGPFTSSDGLKTLERSRRAINLIFTELKEANSEAWDLGASVGFCRNAGFNAVLRIVSDGLELHKRQTHIDLQTLSPSELAEIAHRYLEPLQKYLKENETSGVRHLFRDQVPLGAAENREIYYKLIDLCRSANPALGPDDFEDWKAARNDERKRSVSEKLQEINAEICQVLFDILKTHYGQEGYFERAVKDKRIIIEATTRSLDYSPETRGDLEGYLHLAEYKKIMTSKDHWPLVRHVFDIPLDGVRGVAKNIDWLDKLIPIRNKVMHPTTGRPLELSDITFVEGIYSKLMNNISNHRRNASYSGAAK